MSCQYWDHWLFARARRSASTASALAGDHPAPEALEALLTDMGPSEGSSAANTAALRLLWWLLVASPAKTPAP
jgi:hypothetical protein